MQKSHADLHSATGSAAQSDGPGVVIHEDGTVEKRESTLDAKGADDDASTRGVHSPVGSEGQLGVSGGIPIIRVSTESEIERELAAAANGEVDGNGNGEQGKENVNVVMSPTVEKPMVAAGAAADEDTAEAPRGGQDAFSFTNKRLCERWLDNLFMVLYEVCVIAHGVCCLMQRLPGLARVDDLPR